MTDTDWRDRLRRFAIDVRDDAQRLGKWALLGSEARPYELVAYRGYAKETRALVHGRALESKGIPLSNASDSSLRNLINTYKRIDADPLAGARVEITIGQTTTEVVADDEGFFRAWIDLDAPLPTVDPWYSFALRLLGPLPPGHPEVSESGRLRIPSNTESFGVISDLDDTVIQSRISNFLMAVRTVMLGNARTRLPFPGVAAFYQALERGHDGRRRNPIFYVSSSPWNIYDIIAEFLEVQRIPDGPICLRDWDIGWSALGSRHLKQHKEPLIREILDLYAPLPFILIGDTSQHDPEIYRAIVAEYSSRILAVYIRDVTANPERSAAIRALASEIEAAGSSLILADDTAAAAKHAIDHGWIAAEAMASVSEEKRADEGLTGTKADVPGVTDTGSGSSPPD